MVEDQFHFWGKSCSECGKEKDLEDFPKNRNGLHGRHSLCKECHNKASRERYENQKRGTSNKRVPGYDYRSSYLKRVYGISVAQYEELLEKQHHCCAVCGKHENEEKKSLAVDHNHKTGEVRGLLCNYCNHRLVSRHTDGNLLRKIADYIEQGTGWFVPKKKPKRRKRNAKRN